MNIGILNETVKGEIGEAFKISDLNHEKKAIVEIRLHQEIETETCKIENQNMCNSEQDQLENHGAN